MEHLATHRSTEELEACLPYIETAPAASGTVRLIVRRPDVDAREVLDQGHLSVAAGLEGDNWLERGSSVRPDGSADPLRQLTVMSARVLESVTDATERWAEAGDQLIVDMDISHENIPAGTLLNIGSAVIEITEPPHTGCPKFKARFGVDALRWVNSPRGRQLRLRGANARVVADGVVRAGDLIAPQH